MCILFVTYPLFEFECVRCPLIPPSRSEAQKVSPIFTESPLLHSMHTVSYGLCPVQDTRVRIRLGQYELFQLSAPSAVSLRSLECVRLFYRIMASASNARRVLSFISPVELTRVHFLSSNPSHVRSARCPAESSECDTLITELLF